jgi:pimeloyl-ACP methyl ester carboxylesterase
VVRDRLEATAQLRELVQPGDVVLFENDLPDTYDDGRLGVRGSVLGTQRDKAASPSRKPEQATPAASRVPTPKPQPLTTVRVSGLRVAYRQMGAESGRLPIVVLHGWGASSAAVTSIQRCFEGARRTVAPDLPGFGQSNAPAEAWGTAEYGAALRDFLGHLEIEQADFIGHSFGGKIAIQLAATTPNLVRRLILVDSSGIRGPVSLKRQARVLLFKTARRVVRALPVRRPDLQDSLERRFGSEDYRQAGALRPTLVRLVNEDLRPLLPRIAAPTLLIWGERDDATPLADGQLMEREIPDAGLVAFPGAGHYSYADDPGRFCRVAAHFLNAS